MTETRKIWKSSDVRIFKKIGGNPILRKASDRLNFKF